MQKSIRHFTLTLKKVRKWIFYKAKFVRRLICATLANLWPLPVGRSSFSHVKNHKEYVVGWRKKQTFDSLDLFDTRFFLTIFDHFYENFCKIKQHIKQILRFFHVNQRKKFILWKPFVSMKLFISLTTDTFSIRPISILGCFSSKRFFSDIMNSRSRKKIEF